MRPILLELPLPGELVLRLPAYGTFLAVGFLIAALVAGGRARRLGVGRDELFHVGFLAIVAGLVGGHLLELAIDPDRGLAGPAAMLSAFRPWDGGLAYYGGLAAGAAVMIAAARSRSVPVLDFLDVVAPVSVLALGVTRVGCFLNGCCYGQPSDVAWAVVYPAGSAAQHQQFGLGLVERLAPALPVHPTQLYEALVAVLLFAALWARYPRRRYRGEVLFLFLAGYAVWRFASQFLRADRGPLLAGLDVQQFLSLLVLAVGVGGLLLVRSRAARVGGIDRPASGS